MQYWLHNEEETMALGANLAKILPSPEVLFLYGQLGAGKTTFVRGFLTELGYRGPVKSPTYTLVEPYLLHGQEIFHFDLYRINTPEELLQIGLEDYFTPTSICLIEWPERAKDFLPSPTLSCHLLMPPDGKGRYFTCTASTLNGQKILKNLEGGQ